MVLKVTSQKCRSFIKEVSSYCFDTYWSERDRFSLWIPVFIGLGILGYFALKTEPSMQGSIIAGVSLFLMLILFRKYKQFQFFLKLLCLIYLGFVVSQIRTAWIATPILSAEYKGVVEGNVEEIDHLEKTARLTLSDVYLRKMPKDQRPKKIRIRLLNGETNLPKPGQRVRVYGVLSAPSPPALPDGFDFQRFMYFKSIGAVGYALGHPEEAWRPGVNHFWTFFNNIREVIIKRIQASLTAERAQVAIALLTGDKNPISKERMNDIRASGLAHLLAISGLHISLVAGLFYGAIRGGLALFPRIALRYPIKKWAILVGFFVAIFYMFLVGASIPTQRASFMLFLVVLAVLTDREAITMRLVCLAATVILVFLPESLLSPSFQMSFAAVACLVAFYENYKANQFFIESFQSFWSKSILYILGLWVTSFVSTLATAPFSLFHFNTVSLYGVLANMIAVPVTAFWVMPAGIVAIMMMPLGLEKVPLLVMGWGIDVILKTAEWVASMPYSLLILKKMPDYGFGLVLFGGLWLILWQKKWRYAGLVPIMFGFLSILTYQIPDVVIADKGKLVGFYGDDQKLYLTTVKRDKFIADIWMKSFGLQEKHPLWVSETHEKNHGAYVIREGEGGLMLHKQTGEAILNINQIIDQYHQGSQMIYLRNGDVDIITDHGLRGQRPWVY